MTLVITGLDEKGTQEITALAQRLGASVVPQPLAVAPTMTQEEWARRVQALAGSWSPEDADEIERAIEEAREEQRRMDHSHRDIEW